MPGTLYPAALDTTTSLRTVADTVDDVLAIDQNYPRDAILALEAKVGYSASTPISGVFLKGTGTGTSAWASITEADLVLSAVTTNNVSVSQHGFVPTLSGSATQFFNGQGNYVTISGTGVPSGYNGTTFSGQTSVNVVHNFGIKPLVQVLDNSGSPLVEVPLAITHNSDNDFTVTFSTAQSGTILTSAGSPPIPNVTTTSTNYTVLTNDNIIIATASSITITLPTGVGVTGKTYTIDNNSSGDISVVGTGGETVWGEASQTVPSQSAMTVYSTGSNWRVL